MKTRLLLDYLVASLSADVLASPSIGPIFIPERRPKEIWKQKVFCVLSSQCSAPRSATIADLIVDSIPFFENELTAREVEVACSKLLKQPSVRYRFPNARAKQISYCWLSFAQIADKYHEFICLFSSEDAARHEIVRLFPGMGLKQASMFMLNIGVAKGLAIIDVHILWYLSVCHGWSIRSLTEKAYLEAEDVLRRDASDHGVDLNVFDAIVWNAVKVLKSHELHV